MDIVGLVSQYRELKAKMRELEAEIEPLKAEIETLVKVHGNWQDAEGYARLVTTQPSVSFDAKAVNALVEAWQASADPVMRSCGDMLAKHRQEKHGTTYISIK